MTWKLVTLRSQRKELVSLALTDGANKARLCRRFEISRKIGYKWLARYRATGEAGLADRSRRPHRSPGETKEALVAAVLAARTAHPAKPGCGFSYRISCPRPGSLPRLTPQCSLTILGTHDSLI